MNVEMPELSEPQFNNQTEIDLVRASINSLQNSLGETKWWWINERDGIEQTIHGLERKLDFLTREHFSE